ncbi:TonB-dependent receptor [Chitinophaga nivalis]|uniref:TonB-dependent receptor plug domain-containing protein n=1 Tax=Chitinophaga nivalis TaxID=2991709 RepID=A0ABT3IQD1_9BACT|nr:TonB-dependent receptor plug domain-containing protein [Chitinophaga nivalis]MCW3464229.1 TonB-dependent receptor plug domain-containing protein [Chitinophaga nivalis]MCW3486081.1 TonB-dependent receptor plug domain-containing protein [Chitinophaga nivalis]
MKRLIFSGFSAVMMAAGSVAAQDSSHTTHPAPVAKHRSQADTTSQLGEVIVTASRVAESINEVPSSVTVISRKEVEKLAQINNNLPYILMQKVPGISPSEESQNNFIGKIRGRNFLVLIDGVPQSTPLRNGGRDLRSIDVSAIDHIEVINGASAMYGNGGAGGIINYITKKPVRHVPFTATTFFNNSLNLAKTDGTYTYNLSQVFSGQIHRLDYVIQGKIARTGVSRSADGEVISPFYGLGETNTYNALVKIGYDISDKHRIEVMGNYYNSIQDSKYIGTTGKLGISPAIGIPGDTSIAGGTPYNKTLNIKYTGTYGKTTASITAYYDDMNTVFEAYNQIYADHWGARLNFNTPFTLSAKSNVQLIYGMDFLKDHTVQKDIVNKLITPEMYMNSIAPYLQSKFVLASSWILKAGVRFEQLGFRVGDLVKAGKLIPGVANNYHALVFNAGARYNKLSYLQPFASFSQGFSIGDVGLVLRNGISLNAIDATPVKVNNVEAGISGTIHQFTYELTGYYSTTRKSTTYAETSTPGNYELIQMPQRIYGVEAVMGFKATDWLNLGSTVGYMNGREDAKNNGHYDAKPDNAVISPLKISGNANVSITRHWDLMLQVVKIGARDVFPKEVYNYGKYPISGYTLLDVFTAYKFKRVTLNFSINNLLNTNYYPIHSEVRGATNEGRYYVKGSGAVANIGAVINW